MSGGHLVGSCPLIHPNISYYFRVSLIQNIVSKCKREKKDLGVIIDTELKFYAQCFAVVNKVKGLLGLIKMGFLKISAYAYVYKPMQIICTTHP